MRNVEQVGFITRRKAAELGLLGHGFRPLEGSGPLHHIECAMRFADRPAAESDPSRKQIIPYAVVLRGDQVFAAERLTGGGESRLHGKLSIGIGGHVNPIDERAANGVEAIPHRHPIDSGPSAHPPTASVSWGRGDASDATVADGLIMETLRRELDEELITEGIESIRLCGTINDDEEPVGKVHLGVVFAVELAPSGQARVREVEALRGGFRRWDELLPLRDRLETWSAFVFDAFYQSPIP
jgi:predicted NUDIX family phosphoesterase